MRLEDRPRHCPHCETELGATEMVCPNCRQYTATSDAAPFVVATIVGFAVIYAWAKATGRDGLINFLEWFI
jgi:hypothetical protein